MKYLYLAVFIVAIAAATFASYSLFRRMPYASEERKENWKKVSFGTFILLSLVAIYVAVTKLF